MSSSQHLRRLWAIANIAFLGPPTRSGLKKLNSCWLKGQKDEGVREIYISPAVVLIPHRASDSIDSYSRPTDMAIFTSSISTRLCALATVALMFASQAGASSDYSSFSAAHGSFLLYFPSCSNPLWNLCDPERGKRFGSQHTRSCRWTWKYVFLLFIEIPP